MRALMAWVLLLQLKCYIPLRTWLWARVTLVPYTRQESSLNLAQARGMMVLLICILWLVALIASLPLVGVIAGVVALWWSIVLTWVVSIPRSKGPATHLLIFREKFRSLLLLLS